MKKIFFLIIAISLLFFGCQNANEDADSSPAIITESSVLKKSRDQLMTELSFKGFNDPLPEYLGKLDAESNFMFDNLNGYHIGITPFTLEGNVTAILISSRNSDTWHHKILERSLLSETYRTQVGNGPTEQMIEQVFDILSNKEVSKPAAFKKTQQGGKGLKSGADFNQKMDFEEVCELYESFRYTLNGIIINQTYSVHCYTTYNWEETAGHNIIIDAGSGSGGGVYKPLTLREIDERKIDEEPDPRVRFGLQLDYLQSHGGDEGKALAKMLKELIDTDGITWGDAFEVFSLTQKLYLNLKGQFILTIFSIENISTIISFGLTNGLSNVAKTGFSKAIARYGSAFARNTGMTVLGKYPEYLSLAQKLGANRFTIPIHIWNSMTTSQQWTANLRFLDRAIARGDKIILSTRVTNINSITGWFRKELDYLISKGYKLSKNGTYLFK